MKKNQTHKLVLLSMIAALTVVLGYYLKIPTPTGILTFLDAGIFFTTFRSLSTDNELAFRGIIYTSFMLVMRKGFEPLNSAVKGR